MGRVVSASARGGYNDIPDNDNSDYDDDSYGDGGVRFGGASDDDAEPNPFAANGDGKPPASIRAGGARRKSSSLYDDDSFHDEEYDHERPSRRNGAARLSSSRDGHRRMKVETLGSLQSENGSGKYKLYCVLAMLISLVIMFGALKVDRVSHHPRSVNNGDGNGQAGSIGVEGYARPNNNDDDDDIDGGKQWDDDEYDDDHYHGEAYHAAKQQQGGSMNKPKQGKQTTESVDSSSSVETTSPVPPSSSKSSNKVPGKKQPHHRDPTATFRSHDPFHLTDTPWYGSVFAPPPFPAFARSTSNADVNGEEDDDDEGVGRGYFQSPSIHNSTLVFCSEGDLYLTQLPDNINHDESIDSIPSVKLTTTVGNVLTPRINPFFPYLIAFTATYTGTREAYLMDLRPSSSQRGAGLAGPALRLTYFDGVYGVQSVVGWDGDGTSLIIATMHDEIGMEDVRMYKIGIVQGRQNIKKGEKRMKNSGGDRWVQSREALPISVSSVQPIPLHQAIDGAMHKPAKGVSSCLFFTRFKQSSNTFRYVGGTAEHIWAYCEGEDRAVALSGDYRGTSRSPGIYSVDGEDYLLYVSDRHDNGDGTWAPGTLNLWATPLPTQDELYSSVASDSDGEAGALASRMQRPFQLTRTNCECNGKSLMEYSIDDITGNIVLRIGADLHLVEKAKVVELLQNGIRKRRLDGSVTNNDDDDIADDDTVTNDDDSTDDDDVADDDANDDDDATDTDDASDVDATGTQVAAPTGGNNIEEEEKEKDVVTIEAEAGEPKKKGKNKRGKTKGREKATSSTDKQTKPSAIVPKKATIASTDTILGSRALPISIISDLQNLHERLLPVEHSNFVHFLDAIDAYNTPYGTTSALVTIRGQAWINPVIPDLDSFYNFGGGGANPPPRRYRVAPGSTTGGMTRVLNALHVPQPEKYTRTSLMLSTDPLSPTAELAFYLIETLADGAPAFADTSDLPRPILGGHLNGGSTKKGGLGSIKDGSVAVSPCGRRVAWRDTDGRICAMALPNLGDYWTLNATELESMEPIEYVVLPQENENGQPMIGDSAELTWSPGGRYLAIEHNARNQFSIISIADLGEIVSPVTDEKGKNTTDSAGEVVDKANGSDAEDDEKKDEDEEDRSEKENWNITVGRIVQATPDRFNSGDAYWGQSAFDMAVDKAAGASSKSKVLPTATTLFYLTDRDIILSGVSSPWGTRAPSPHFKKDKCVYALPLVVDAEEEESDEDDDIQLVKKMLGAPYSGGGASELSMLRETALEEIEAMKEEEENAKRKEETQDGDSKAVDGNNSDDRRKNRRLKAKVVATTKSPTAAPTSEKANATSVNTTDAEQDVSEPSEFAPDSLYPKDVNISFGPVADQSFVFARRSYRLSNIPKGGYVSIVSQLNDDASLVLLEKGDDGGSKVVVFSIDDFPSDGVDPMPVELKVSGMEVIVAGQTTSRRHLFFIYRMPGKVRTKIIGNDASSVVSLLIKDASFTKNIVDNSGFALSIWPALEYQQMYADAWRMLRDFFYDEGMTDIDWEEVYERYQPLINRCAKREEVDDVLKQMSAELSALHVFVYGGEYNQPLHDDLALELANEVASLGATLRRSEEWGGYKVTSVPERDPDFGLMDDKAIYSPLSNDVLRMSGQRGLQVGDVIIGVNGESVMNVPSMHMLLRGKAGQSVRLEVLRVESGPSPLLAATRKTRRARATSTRNGRRVFSENDTNDKGDDKDDVSPEPLIAVPLSPNEAAHLRYTAWEWKTRQSVKELSRKAGFTAGYIHLRDMSGGKAEDAFVRGFYPDFDKQALIVDVRHNHGGNIDSWLLDVLQRKAWMYWQGRATNVTSGGLGWDEQFAFRGHIVVLIDEKTSSDGEGFSRGVSELGLGKLVGTRTWGGGIWLSSDNKLVDGGIASAPEIGTYNKNFGWGLGIENMGVEPDYWVDNEPHATYGGRDAQLEKAIEVLKDWLKDEPVVLPENPGKHRDMSIHEAAKGCPAN